MLRIRISRAWVKRDRGTGRATWHPVPEESGREYRRGHGPERHTLRALSRRQALRQAERRWTMD